MERNTDFEHSSVDVSGGQEGFGSCIIFTGKLEPVTLGQRVRDRDGKDKIRRSIRGERGRGMAMGFVEIKGDVNMKNTCISAIDNISKLEDNELRVFEKGRETGNVFFYLPEDAIRGGFCSASSKELYTTQPDSSDAIILTTLASTCPSENYLMP